MARSGYYAFKSRGISDRYLANAYLANQVHTIYTRSEKTYGRIRIMGQLGLLGVTCSHKRLAALMAENSWVGAHSRKKWRRGKGEGAPAPDLLNRNFNAEAPNEKWVADVTEFKTGEGKLQLAGIFDLCDKALVS